MRLLKIGMLDMQSERWLDALETFESVTVIKGIRDEKQVDGLNYYEFDMHTSLRRLLLRFIMHFNENRHIQWFEYLLICLYRLTINDEKKFLKGLEYDEVHVSYNDYDESALLLCLLKPYLRKGVRITRAYKETRPEFKYLERKAFEYSDRIVLNANENYDFFVKKYGKALFDNKEIICGLDEDAIGKKYISGMVYLDKLSKIDGKYHVVILAGRVFSDNTDLRSGSRLYYIPMIKECIKAGLIVHLHTMHIYNDKLGINQYEVLKEQYPDTFFIEPALDFTGENWKNAYSTLTRYDYGIMHNFIEGTPNTEFDKYNIPHRYYEYQLAHVAPLLLNNKTIVMQRILKEQQTGVIYSDFKELLKPLTVTFNINCFANYIKELYR